MTNTAKEKSKFRKTSKWMSFRALKKKKSDKLDDITKHPLRKGWSLHHKDLNPDHYQILKEDLFSCLNKQTHNFIHWLFRYYVKDHSIIDRIKALMDEMEKLNKD